MDLITILGLMAGTLTTASFLPQLIQAWRTKSVKDISLTMFIVFSIGLVLWTVYGVLIGSIPVILTNTITLTLALMIILLKLKHS